MTWCIDLRELEDTDSPEKVLKAIRCLEQNESVADAAGAARAANRWAALGTEVGDMSKPLVDIAANDRAMASIRQLANTMGDRKLLSTSAAGRLA